jgi:hypothetical protein
VEVESDTVEPVRGWYYCGANVTLEAVVARRRFSDAVPHGHFNSSALKWPFWDVFTQCSYSASSISIRIIPFVVNACPTPCYSTLCRSSIATRMLMVGRIPLTTTDPCLAHPDCSSNRGETPVFVLHFRSHPRTVRISRISPPLRAFSSNLSISFNGLLVPGHDHILINS